MEDESRDYSSLGENLDDEEKLQWCGPDLLLLILNSFSKIATEIQTTTSRKDDSGKHPSGIILDKDKDTTHRSVFAHCGEREDDLIRKTPYCKGPNEESSKIFVKDFANATSYVCEFFTMMNRNLQTCNAEGIPALVLSERSGKTEVHLSPFS